VVHEDEQFWAWLFYLYGHLKRGEFYHCAAEFSTIRNVVEQWSARLANQEHFSNRGLEWQDYAAELVRAHLFPSARRDTLKTALLDLIDIQLRLREKITECNNIAWNTSQLALTKIQELIKTV